MFLITFILKLTFITQTYYLCYDFRLPKPIQFFGYAKPEKYHGFPVKGAYKMTLFSGKSDFTIIHLTGAET